MALVQRNDEPGRLQRFAQLRWLDAAIGFVFHLIARLAEPFLAFGLIVSAIDYVSHGQILSHNDMLRAIWVTTQAVALEGSGGYALSMSFEAQASRDHVKAWTQRMLSFLLMVTGGIMFFAEMSASAPGWSAVVSSPAYIYGMAALRTIVALGYIAMMRTAHHRFSGEETQPGASPAPVDDIHQLIETQMAALREEVRGQIEEIPAIVRSAISATTYEVDSALLIAQIEEAARRALDQALSQRPPIFYETQITQIEAHTDPQLKALPAPGDSMRSKVHRYIEEQRAATGTTPSTKEVMQHCGCAESTARQYRREVCDAH